MISHKNKCIYVHIPKVAGTTITEILEDPEPIPLADTEDIVNDKPFANSDLIFNPPPPHFRVSDYLKYGLINEQQLESYFKFSFVRNPWARIVSEYIYHNNASKYPFKDYIFNHFPTPRWSDEYCHVIPQYNFLYDVKGNRQVDFVGKLENIQEDFNQVCKQLKIPVRQLTHSNKSQSFFQLRSDAGFCDRLKRLRAMLSWTQKQNTFDNYRKYYDTETKDYVADIYKKDIEVFNYEFD
jgi:Sulfotransferase family